MSDSNEEKRDDWVSASIGAFIFIGTLVFFWPSLIKPFSFFEFWVIKGDLWQTVWSAWPLYTWGIVGTLIFSFFRENRREDDVEPMVLFVTGILRSAIAGIIEEIAFRWLLFLSAVVMLPVVNWIFLGFMGLDIVQWVYTAILCPIANFFTFGYLEPYLMNGYGWAVGAAVISSNGRFRNGHAYLGPIGYVNSWFGGMYLHYIVFTYGIISAIIIHFLYDFCIFTLYAIIAGMSRRRVFS
jgi:hypothetical protein